jgi:hypothetical protein
MEEQHAHDSLCHTCRSLPIGSVGCTCKEIGDLRAISFKGNQYHESCIQFATNILKVYSPGCTPGDSLIEILIQIEDMCQAQSNWTVGKEGFIQQVEGVHVENVVNDKIEWNTLG